MKKNEETKKENLSNPDGKEDVVGTYLIGAVPYLMGIKHWVDGVSNPYQLMRNGDFPCNGKPKGGSFRVFITDFLASLISMQNLKEKQAGIYVNKEDVDGSDPNEVRCIINAGKYGLLQELRSMSGSSVKQREFDDCALMPFNVRFVFSEQHEQAIVIVERFGMYSPATILFEAISKYIDKIFQKSDRVSLETRLISNLEYIRKQYSQRIKALHFITNSIPHDISSHLNGDLDLQKDCHVDIKLSAGRNKYLQVPELMKKIVGTETRGVTIGGTTYEDIKVELKIGKRTQTVIAGIDSFRIVYDITDKVELSENRHPTKESFLKASEDCLVESKRTLQWKS